MIEWLRDKFSSLVGFCFVLFVIFFTATGAIVGSIIGETVGAILGLVIGILIGIVFGIMIFGFVATIINISETIDYIYEDAEEIKELLSNSAQASSQEQSSESETTYVNPEPKVSVLGDYKICKKCGTKNPSKNVTCKDCGEYL